MHITLSKWGNSLGIRIPNSITKEMGLSAQDTVEISRDGDHIIIQKIYRLDSLLSQITPDNLHSEEDTGNAQGKETW
jgi:antitoxin MazE